MTNEEMRPSIGEYLDDVKEGLETPSDDSRLSAIENGMLNLKSQIRGMKIETETVSQQQTEERFEPDKLALADAALDLYRNNIQEKAEKKEEPSTRASRANTKAMIRSLSGHQMGGNSGKTSYEAGPNGSGDVGAPVPGNVTLPPLEIGEETMEEYQARVFESFGLDEACWAGYTQKGMKTMFGRQYPNCVKKTAKKTKKEEVEFTTEDVVSDLEEILLELDDTSWQSIDKAMRQLCQEHDMTPKQLHKDFKAKHGMIPDQWIKEQEVTEECGWLPLDEMTRVNKVGQLYDVSFIFRGGTSRFKFFWPSPQRPSKKEMQAAVEKFYPKARLLAYYPCMHQDEDNYMVMVPPMTENYEMIPEDTWDEMPEEINEVYHQICEEVGEPISFPMVDEESGDIFLYVEDHDTGEEQEVIIEGGLHAWFSKSKSKDGKPGWVQSDGSPCANEKGETKVPKCYSSQRLAALKRSKKGKNLIKAADARKRREDPGQQSKSGAAKPTMVKTFAKASDKKKYKSGDQTLKDESFNPLNEDEMKGLTVKSGHKRSVKQGAGLTQKGVDAVNRRTGGNLKTAVTTPPSKLKPGSKAANRRKSFCARSRGWTGERGKAARRRWNC